MHAQCTTPRVTRASSGSGGGRGGGVKKEGKATGKGKVTIKKEKGVEKDKGKKAGKAGAPQAQTQKRRAREPSSEASEIGEGGEDGDWSITELDDYTGPVSDCAIVGWSGRDCVALSTTNVCWACTASHSSCGVVAGTSADWRFELGVDDLVAVPAPAVEKSGLPTRESEIAEALEYVTQWAVPREGAVLNLRMAAPGAGESLADYWEWYVQFPEKEARRTEGLARRAPGQLTTPAGRSKSTPRKSSRRRSQVGSIDGGTGLRNQGLGARDEGDSVWEQSPLRSSATRPPLRLATGGMVAGRLGPTSFGQLGSQMREPVSATGMSREWSGSSSSGGSFPPNTPVDDLSREVEARMSRMSPTPESELPEDEVQQRRRERVAESIMAGRERGSGMEPTSAHHYTIKIPWYMGYYKGATGIVPPEAVPFWAEFFPKWMEFIDSIKIHGSFVVSVAMSALGASNAPIKGPGAM
ncbi:hypothetical protein SCHPADRAFT_947830 [Schizopora paradoxa]|uniref:Uncharacterized protein n=1 Tax=Schizopora paradoxa TaxID=27342 RepID=A0A0H2R458_9AGAM|nr:hypothetical protein SCHPADRAFT_947830 [Schizopora paradoxa]